MLCIQERLLVEHTLLDAVLWGVVLTMREVGVMVVKYKMLLFLEVFFATANRIVTVFVVDRKVSLMVPMLTLE